MLGAVGLGIIGLILLVILVIAASCSSCAAPDSRFKAAGALFASAAAELDRLGAQMPPASSCAVK